MFSETQLEQFATQLVLENSESMVEAASQFLKATRESAEFFLKTCYTKYLKHFHETYHKTKSFFIRDEPTDLYNFFVPLDIKIGEKVVLKKVSYPSLISHAKHVVLSGTAGSGKSILMKHLALDSLQSKKRVPIFIELRDLNASRKTIYSSMISAVQTGGFKLDEKYVERGLQAGHYVLFLDGFDEVEHSLRGQLTNEISHFVQKYPKSHVIISTRPDNSIATRANFTVAKVMPLAIDRAVELVEKLPYDQEIKDGFILKLRDSLYLSHESFLSNPLLLSIMLITYGHTADIPSKLNIFYNHAFEALFHRHDAFKGGYKRDRRSSLNIQDFSNAFAAFSLLSYDSRLLSFARSEALTLLSESKALSALDFDTEDFLMDSLQAVCLLMEDGLQITYSHRSFQEYFAAKYICDTQPEFQKILLEKYSQYLYQDNVILLAYEMRSEMVEDLFILPELAKLESRIGYKRRVGITHFYKWLKILDLRVSISAGRGGKSIILMDNAKKYNAKNIMTVNLISFVANRYGSAVGYDPKLQMDWEKLSKLHADSIPDKGAPLVSFSQNSQLIKDLSRYGGILSIEALQAAMDIKRHIQEKKKKKINVIEKFKMNRRSNASE